MPSCVGSWSSWIAIDGHYSFPEDRAIARIPDSQGLGGTLGVQAAINDLTADVGGGDT